MAYKISEKFREKEYSGESLYNCKLTIEDIEVPYDQIESIKISSPITDTSTNAFYIGTFISQSITVKFKNLDGLDIKSGNKVNLEIGQQGKWEYVVENGSNITVENALYAEINPLTTYGNSTQDGTPTPDTPVEIETIKGKNLFDTSKQILTKITYDNNTGVYSATDGDTKTSLQYKIQQQNSSGNFISGTQVTTSVNNTGIISFTSTRVENSVYLRIGNNGATSEFTLRLPFSEEIKVGDTFTVSLNITDTTIGASKFKDVQLEKGSTSSSYVPYGNIQYKTTGTNMINANIIDLSTITVYDNGQKIKMPLITSGNGITNTYIKLYKLCPNLKVGDTVYLNATTTSTINKYIYLTKSTYLWNFGTSHTITQNDLDSDFALYGNRYNSGETEQVIISDLRITKNQNDSFEPYKEQILNVDLKGNELCSIGNTKDELIIQDGKASILKRIGKVVLNGSESWSIGSATYNNFHYFTTTNITDFKKGKAGTAVGNFKSSHFHYVSSSSYADSGGSYFINLLFLVFMDFSTVADFKTWLSTHNTTVYYVLAEPETIELDNVETLNTYDKTTYINNSNNAEMSFTSLKETDDIKDFVYVPIGKYLIDDLAENYQTTCEITCLDYAVKMKTNIDYSSQFVDNEITIENLLKYLCEYYDVELGTYPEINNNIKISTYDNTLSGKQYISYIAELKASNAKFGRDGKLYLIPLKSDPVCTINALTSKSWELSEKYKITNVIYEDAIRKYAYGDDDVEESGIKENTLFIRADNMFVTGGEDIENIYNAVKGFKIYSLKCENFGDITLDSWDVIRYQLGVDTEDKPIYYDTLNNNTLNYAMTIMSTIETKIPTAQQESSVDIINGDSTEAKMRIMRTSINQNTGDITLLTKETTDIKDNLNENYYTITKTNELIQNAETGVTNTFSEAGGNNILRNTGLWFEDDTVRNLVYPSSSMFPSTTQFTGADANYEYWTGYLKKGTNDNATGYNSILLQNGIVYQEQKVPNGNYSLSFWYKLNSEISEASVSINDKKYVLEYNNEFKQFYTGETNSNGEYITLPIEITTGNLKVEFFCNSDNGCEIYDLMCNKGSVKLAYSQNENETTTDTVNISKGITITSSDTDTVFKANADGIRMLDNNNNVKTKFTDKGMETDEAVIKDEAQVCGTMIIEVGEQTWFTRM